MNHSWCNYLAELDLGQFVSRCYRHPLLKSARESFADGQGTRANRFVGVGIERQKRPWFSNKKASFPPIQTCNHILLGAMPATCRAGRSSSSKDLLCAAKFAQ